MPEAAPNLFDPHRGDAPVAEWQTAPPGSPVPTLRCPLCGHDGFEKQRGKLDSHWGFTALKVNLMICERCGYVMQFYQGRTFFGNFD